MIYLASPYTGTLEQMQERYELTKRVTATLLINKRWVYSPIVHCHEMAKLYKLPTDFQFWMAYNNNAIESMDGVYILQIPGWKESKGVQYEIGFAKMMKKSICYVSLNDATPEHDATVAIHTDEARSGVLLCEFALIS